MFQKYKFEEQFLPLYTVRPEVMNGHTIYVVQAQQSIKYVFIRKTKDVNTDTFYYRKKKGSHPKKPREIQPWWENRKELCKELD